MGPGAPEGTGRQASLSGFYRPVGFEELPGWPGKGISLALAAFARSARLAQSRPYRSGSLGACSDAFSEAYAQALTIEPGRSDLDARAFFERYFRCFHVQPDTGKRGFVTGYYEPEAEASPVRTTRFQVPVYRRPDDLVEVSAHKRPNGLDPHLAFARCDGGNLVPYHDREAIDRGALEGRGLELCWLADRVDSFFIHVQGAARLRMLGAREMRVTYAAKSGHPFTGIGSVLAKLGEIPLADVTMQAIRDWLRNNPDRIDEILWRNRSYIFFRETDLGESNLGPIAAAKVQLQPCHSLAVDKALHTFGTPFFIDAPDLTHIGGEPFRQLMIAQDTGSAITGSARGDLFIGMGNGAGEIAGAIKHAADFYALLPRALAERGGP